MRTTITLALVTVAVAGLLAGCTDRPKEWMKVSTAYTTAEFRRDYAQCTKKGDLDEECMKSRGWVPVTPGKEEKTVPDNYRRPQDRR